MTFKQLARSGFDGLRHGLIMFESPGKYSAPAIVKSLNADRYRFPQLGADDQPDFSKTVLQNLFTTLRESAFAALLANLRSR